MTYAPVLLCAFGLIVLGILLIRGFKGISSSTEAAQRRIWGGQIKSRSKFTGYVFIVMGSLAAALELYGLVTGKR